MTKDMTEKTLSDEICMFDNAEHIVKAIPVGKIKDFIKINLDDIKKLLTMYPLDEIKKFRDRFKNRTGDLI